MSGTTATYNLSQSYCPTLAEMSGNFIPFTGRVLDESDVQDSGGRILTNVNSGDVFLFNGTYYMVRGTSDAIQTPDRWLTNWIVVTGELF